MSAHWQCRNKIYRSRLNTVQRFGEVQSHDRLERRASRGAGGIRKEEGRGDRGSGGMRKKQEKRNGNKQRENRERERERRVMPLL